MASQTLYAHEKEELKDLNHRLAELVALLDVPGEGTVVLSVDKTKALTQLTHDYEERFALYQKTLNDLNAEKDAIATELDAKAGEYAALESAKRSLEHQLEAALAQRKALADKANELQAQVALANARADGAANDVASEHAAAEALRKQIEELNAQLNIAWGRIKSEAADRVAAQNELVTYQEKLDILRGDYDKKLKEANEEVKRIALLVDACNANAQDNFNKRLAEALAIADKAYEDKIILFRTQLLKLHEDTLRDKIAAAEFSLKDEITGLRAQLGQANLEIRDLKANEARLRVAIEELRGKEIPPSAIIPAELAAEIEIYRQWVSKLSAVVQSPAKRKRISEGFEHVRRLTAFNSATEGPLAIAFHEDDSSELVVSNSTDKAVKLSGWTLTVTLAGGDVKTLNFKGSLKVPAKGTLHISAGEAAQDGGIAFPDLAAFPRTPGTSIVLADAQGSSSTLTVDIVRPVAQ
eukprot:m.225671 g.225671  ORF g.225671 m.225671 type:complete len:469 (-) comp11302_c0_seq1:60-1466(-)